MAPITRFVMNIARAFRAGWPALIGRSFTSLNPFHLTRIILGGEARRKATEQRLGIPIPRFCILSVTWRCNLDCVGCYTKGYDRNSVLPLDTIDGVIREANRLGSFFFVIVGGEPLMVNHLMDVIASHREAFFFLFTNGTILQSPHVDAIRRSRNILPIISLEGDEHHTDRRRGSGVGQQVTETINVFRRAGIPFGFSTMVTHANARLVTSRAWFDEMWRAGACFGFLVDYVPVPPGADPKLALSDEDLQYKKVAMEKRFYEARPMVLNIPPDEYVSGECQAAGKGMIHINADGNVEPCPFCHYAADNIHRKSLAKILASPFLSELRARLGNLSNPKGECLLFTHAEEVRRIAARTGGYPTKKIS